MYYRKEFSVLFDKHYTELIKFVNGYVNDVEIAKDIVHDVFMSVWKQREKLDFSYSLKAYLFTLGRNASFNYIRNCKIQVNIEEDILKIEPELEEESIEKKIALLVKKMEELPTQQRHVLYKCCVEKKKYKEVAEEMNISLNTVKTHLKRAIKYLREQVGGYYILFLLLSQKNNVLKNGLREGVLIS